MFCEHRTRFRTEFCSLGASRLEREHHKGWGRHMELAGSSENTLTAPLARTVVVLDRAGSCYTRITHISKSVVLIWRQPARAKAVLAHRLVVQLSLWIERASVS